MSSKNRSKIVTAQAMDVNPRILRISGAKAPLILKIRELSHNGCVVIKDSSRKVDHENHQSTQSWTVDHGSARR